MTDLAKQIAQKHGQNDLLELLSKDLSGSQLHTVLLTAIKERVKEQSLTDITKTSKVTQACNLDGRLLHQVEGIAYQSAKDYKVVELAPLNPLGTTNQLSGLDQGNILSTIRAFEVASDPTIGLALNCAHLRKTQEQRKNNLRLCTSQRVVRFPEPTNPAYTAHFKLFSMVDSGRDRGSFGFELDALKSQLTVYLELLKTLGQCGFSHKDIVVELSDTRVVKALALSHGVDSDKIKSMVRASDSDSATRLLAQYQKIWVKAPTNIDDELGQYNLPAHHLLQLKALQKQVMEPLSIIYPGVHFCFNLHRLTGLNYYQGPTLHIKLQNLSDQTFMVADGGFVDWTQRLLTDKKERLLTSAIGIELICRVFK
ncbi:MAG: ATP phosphoribosyltransferase regulatory subunit [Candidatus Obscuribacter sp.]|nr:ATP phosphoribosyltransferase regulatory subunit [Candidatus Obscuribacter sp.]